MQSIASLVRHLDRLQGSRLWMGLVVDDFPELPGVSVETFFPSGPFGTTRGLTERNAFYRRESLYEFATRLGEESGAIDVVLGQAAPRKAGCYSLGVSIDFLHPAALRAEHVILEVNAKTPWSGSQSCITDAPNIVAVDGAGPLEVKPARHRGDVAMASYLLNWIPDGATIEFGIGNWFPPLIARLAEVRKGLRLHTGQIGDWMWKLMRTGALCDTAPVVATDAAGSAAFYDFLGSNTVVQLLPATLTHSPETLRQLPSFRAINSVFEIDLLGRANCEATRSGLRSGLGGLPDFARAAVANPDGLSIIVMNSTAKGSPRIVAELASEKPSLESGDIEILVTERGSADLRSLSPLSRAEAIISLAAEYDQPALREAMQDKFSSPVPPSAGNR